MEKTNHMKTSKFPAKLVPQKNYNGNRSINDNFKTTVDEISEPKKFYDNRISGNQITNSRKFKIALFAAYSSLIAILALIVYTAIILDPKFPF
jgi:hypothetical protein